jgi:hypothetical protein
MLWKKENMERARSSLLFVLVQLNLCGNTERGDTSTSSTLDSRTRPPARKALE